MSVQVNNTWIKIDISIIPKSSLMSPSSPLTSTSTLEHGVLGVEMSAKCTDFYWRIGNDNQKNLSCEKEPST